MEAGTAADVLQQYLVVKRWVLTEIGSGGDDLPVVDDVVALWMAFPRWTECLEFLHVLQVVFVTCCLPEYNVNFHDESSPTMEVRELDSGVHFVRSWLHFRGTVDYGSSSELAQTCQQSVLLSSRLSDVNLATEM